MTEIFSVFKSKRQIKIILVSAALFFFMSTPFKALLSLLPGITEVRPANMLPPILGLFFGPAGAWGVSIGNALADIYMNYTNPITFISGFLIQFLFAYIPYKFWYTFAVKDKAGTPALRNLREIFKYIFIIFVDSAAVTMLLVFSFRASGIMSEIDFQECLLLFANNFDFAIILGIPILVILSSTKLEPFVPTNIQTQKSSEYYDLFIYAIIIIDIIVLSVIKNDSQALAFFMLIVSYVFIFIYVKKPFDKEIISIEDGRKGQFTIKGKVTIGFLIICVLFVFMLGIQSYILIEKNNQGNNLAVFYYIYKLMVVTIHIIFGIMMVVLWYVEKNITDPIELLTETVSLFAKSQHIEENAYDCVCDKCASIKTNDEIEELAKSFSNMVEDIQNYVKNLASVTAERERVTTELNVATQIQASMLPCLFPAFPNRSDFDIFATMNPAKEVGGDFYDFFLVGENKLAFVMADVSGKGVPAALFMMISKSLIKNLALEGLDIEEVFYKANNQLNENNEAFMFVTAFLGLINLNTGEFQYINAGHNPPLIKRKDGKFEWLNVEKNCILAVMPNIVFKKQSAQINPGDIIFTYTDGVTEAVNTKTEFYGDDRLEQNLNVIEDVDNAAISDIVKIIRATIDDFADGADQADDITMLIFKYFGK